LEKIPQAEKYEISMVSYVPGQTKFDPFFFLLLQVNIFSKYKHFGTVTVTVFTYFSIKDLLFFSLTNLLYFMGGAFLGSPSIFFQTIWIDMSKTILVFIT